MDFDVIVEYMPMYVKAFFLTVKIGWIGIVLSLLIGIVAAFILHFKIPVLAQMVKLYVEIFRNTPLLVQLFFIYFGLPKVGLSISAEVCGAVGLGLLGGSYMAESFRSGLEAVPVLQMESALALGMNRLQMFQSVILPQAFSISVPAIVANIIFLLKETSVFSAISLMDLMFTAKDLIGQYYNTTECLVMLVGLCCYRFLFLEPWLSTKQDIVCLEIDKMGFEILLKGNNMIRLLQGVWVALRISLISVVLSMAFGILLGMIMTSKNRIIRAVTRVYLEIVRIMPQLVLLFIVYFGATKAMGINMDAETASIIVFVFWGTAEMADLVRGSLLSVPKIQYESSEALGLDQRQTYQYVIIPQIIRRMIPLSINLITRMIKTTSLVMMIGIVEVLKVGQQIIEANRKTAPNAAFAIFATVLLLYFIACWPISCLSKYLEKRWEN